jgi:serine/threonine-protein kinase
VTALIGEGGMGKVWRARHTALNRDDALKVLPEALASDPDRLARFRREAQLLASLNHPNIAHVHGLEQVGDVQALVMELVEGPTLADRIGHGPLPIDETLALARQIASALAAAHEQGIVHRDLKPSNIKVRPDGTVKVLDFGLAKALDTGAATGRDASLSPTITSPAMMTGIGVLLGTAAYMSPEQAKGKPADKRSDIWAFGCVLYEMLTGRRAFDGEDVADTIAAVLRGQPDWAAMPSALPKPIRLVTQRCLEKDRKRRIADMATVVFLLDEQSELVDSVAPVPVSFLWNRRRVRAKSVAAVVLTAIASAGAAWVMLRPVPLKTQPVRFVIAARSEDGPLPGLERSVAISPDGTQIVYVSNSSQLLRRAIDRLELVPLPGTVGATSPFFSPDGQWVGFFSQSELKKVSLSGGAPVTVCRITGLARGASWGSDGTIVFATNDPTTGLLTVPASGGNPQVLTKVDRLNDQADHVFPVVLPGGRYLLFSVVPQGGRLSNEGVELRIYDRTTGESKTLMKGAGTAQYVPPGYLVYATGTSVTAAPFNLKTGAITGDAVPVVDQVSGGQGVGSQFAVSDTGTLVFLPVNAASGPVSTPRSVVWVDRNGQEHPTSWPVRSYTYPRLSPDGSRVAFDIRDQDLDIWIGDLARESLTRLTFDPAADFYPVWTPDSRSIIFYSSRDRSGSVYRQAADGTGSVERLTTTPTGPHYPHSISPDGKDVLFQENTQDTRIDLALLRLAPTPTTAPLIRSPFAETNGEISPDGRWIAYQSNESGREEIYVRPFPDVDHGRWQVSTEGGTRPLWARSGRELFYLDREGLLTSVNVQSQPTFTASKPVRLLKTRYFAGFGGAGQAVAGRTYDVSADGKLFLMLKDAQREEGTPGGFVVMTNWAEQLKRVSGDQ